MPRIRFLVKINIRAYLAFVFPLYITRFVLGHMKFKVTSILEGLVAFLAVIADSTVTNHDVFLQRPTSDETVIAQFAFILIVSSMADLVGG